MEDERWDEITEVVVCDVIDWVDSCCSGEFDGCLFLPLQSIIHHPFISHSFIRG